MDGVSEMFARKAAEAEKELGENFSVGGKVYLVICPECGKENYGPAVSHGICAWCGYNANKVNKYDGDVYENSKKSDIGDTGSDTVECTGKGEEGGK